MKRLFFILALAGVFAVSCEKVVEVEKIVEKECDKQHYEDEECDREHLPEVAPKLTLTAGAVTVESVSFVLAPTDAAAVRYSVVEAGTSLPTAEDLFNKESEFYGVPADATIEAEYLVSSLRLGTEYTVVAAARNNIGYSEVVTLAMTTAIPEMSLGLSVVKINSSSVVFSISPVNASKVAYKVLAAGEEVPEATVVLESGVEADATAAGEYVVKGLEPESSYVIVAAALDLAEKNAMLSDAVEVTTIAVVPPAVGDYYYSDGSWSTEYDDTKTPIGVVFYLGCATEFKDNVAYYKVKDGSAAMEEFHGYVIALKDASPEDGVWWSFYDSWGDPTGVSVETNDFLGYTNTLAIRTEAERLGVGFSADNSSYPAAYYATDAYDEVCPAPAQSSGWFLPSAGQLQYIWDSAYFNPNGNLKGWLENSFRNLGELAVEMHVTDSEYWSSTEQVDSYGTSVRAYYVNFDSSNWNPGFTSWYNKDVDFRVRSVLAF